MGDMSREPSMEDILSSIRRVIARDEAPGAARDAQAVRVEDILDLQDEDVGGGDPAPSTEELVSAASADAARQSLEALSAAVTPDTAATNAHVAPVPAARTMEDVVLDALRPMLKDWLDTNLPSLVEAMVAKEISRITGKRL
ncbi:DUF2497 domain-containing protein [Sphingopyxis macrogoltabida]|uniref:DUF2497 domain-containing protein n=2 Tax=Sphingopyxis macrogoltabida TaxID=33050 RepID=A0AAC9FGL0_SPHMC|nr:DUF2497 domain-containing protein [Sphingopyxis macrogoltabida]ALJ15380.1 hypothetical protein LH19_21110 [Sphingopyxis macrogoltabida]AMU91628.1 hypothetical protein ATM17_21685 [Sphingopyxis macrogoltabida]